MFNLLLALITGLLIGWNFHAFFIQLNPPNILRTDINISKIEIIEKTSQKIIDKPKLTEGNITTLMPIKENFVAKKTSMVDTFYTLLEKELFSDAMSLYLDAPDKKLAEYRFVLLKYFEKNSPNNPSKTINQMLEFKELESKHKKISLHLIKTYQDISKYKEAIDVITQLIDIASEAELETLYSNLIKTSKKHMQMLQESKSFQILESFLKERIELNIKAPFYIYSLAQYYIDIQKFTLATELLKEIEYDYNYEEKVKNLLNTIKKKVVENKEYTHQLALKKVGEHFTLEVEIDNQSLTLLLDTGASLTMINENKLPSSLIILKESIILNTAGGEINAQLQEAETFSVGNIELKKFQIVSSSFEQKDADGLLGMNFFKQFRFKIDQEKAVLYLSEKED